MSQSSNPHENRPAGAVEAVIDPPFAVTPVRLGSLLQIYHPLHGWLTFLMPPEEGEKMAAALNQRPPA